MPTLPTPALWPLIAALLMPPTAYAQPLPGRVLRVVDGDTLMLDVQGGQHRISLAGIDAPESNQPWGASATGHLHRTLTGRFVVVELRDDTSVGGIVYKGRDVALDMLSLGLAWSTVADQRRGGPGGAPPTHPYTLAEQAARDAARGLWQDPLPIPPWLWRHGADASGTQKKRATLPH